MKWRILGRIALVALVLSLGLVTTAGAAVPRDPFEIVGVGAFSNQTVQIWDLATDSVSAPLDIGVNVMGAAVSADGTRALIENTGTANVLNGVVEMNVQPLQVLNYFPLVFPEGAVFSPDDNTAYVLSGLGANINSYVTPINLNSGAQGTRIPVGRDPQDIVMSPDGTLAFVCNFLSDNVTPIDLTTLSALPPISLPGKDGSQVAISPDGTTLYATSDDVNGTYLTPIDVATMTAGTPMVLPAGNGQEEVGAGLAVSPDGKTAYIVVGNANAPNLSDLQPVNLENLQAEQPIPLEDDVAAGTLAISPDSSTAYVSLVQPALVMPIDLADNVELPTETLSRFDSGLITYPGSPSPPTETPEATVGILLPVLAASIFGGSAFIARRRRNGSLLQ